MRAGKSIGSGTAREREKPEMSRIYYVMGKSASGKDTVFKELLKRCPDLKRLVPWTTRPMRTGETEGLEYHFTTPEGIRAFEEAGKLAEKRVYDTVFGPWTYATVDDGSISRDGKDRYLGIGTLESYVKLRAHFGEELLFPLYIEVDDGERLRRAIAREEAQASPHFDEMCRRYLADLEDFSEEKLAEAGITRRYRNDVLERCLADIMRDMVY